MQAAQNVQSQCPQRNNVQNPRDGSSRPTALFIPLGAGGLLYGRMPTSSSRLISSLWGRGSSDAKTRGVSPLVSPASQASSIVIIRNIRGEFQGLLFS